MSPLMRMIRGVLCVGAWLMCALPSAWAQLIVMKVSGDSGFNVPANLANYVTIDFGTVTLASQVSASRMSLGGTALTFPTSSQPPSFSGAYAQLASGHGVFSSSSKTSTINIANGGTSYLEFLWAVSVDNENTLKTTFTHNDGTTVTISNCQANTSGCVGGYTPSWWLSDLINGLLGLVFGSGQPSYDTVYVSYQPPAGKTVTKVDFYAQDYVNCVLILLCGRYDQYIWIDNLRYVNAGVAPHHLEVTSASASGPAGTPVTFTIRACADAACSVPYYTSGISGNLAVSGTGMTVTYPAGAAFTIAPGASSTTVQATISPAGTVTVGVSGLSKTPSGGSTAYCGLGVTASSTASCTFTTTVPLHHLNIKASNGLTCAPTTYTIDACADATCSTPYTSGASGTLAVTGSGMTVNYPSGAGFSIASSSSTTTVPVFITTVGSVTTATVSGLSVTPTGSPSVYCGMNGATPASGGSCTVSVANSALLFDVPAHYAEVPQSVQVKAVRASDSNAALCVPGLASTTKSVLFKCAYTNPATGTLPVRVGGAALNASNSTSAACDATGRSVSLTFDAGGIATTTVQYADVGLVGLTATYTGSGTDAGLSMTGTDAFIAAPYVFGVSGITSGPITAGNSFSATVTARNYAANAVPNFGRESGAEGATLSFVRTRPTGTAAVNGSFSGTLGTFNAGAATGSNLQWSEVGYGDVAASLTSSSYLGSGLQTAGSSASTYVASTMPGTYCAAENGTCTLPAGATAAVFYGANGFIKVRTGQTGSVACTNAVFTDPIVGTAKTCTYVVTSGASPGVTGAAGAFIPHHFTVSTGNACGAFSYSGQPFALTATAYNAANVVTANYDGSLNTSPNYAKALTVSATTNGGTGSVGNATQALSSFVSGVATIAASSTSPSFTFTNKQTAPSSVGIRVTDADGVSSSGYPEGTVDLRSGQLKFSNAFGSEKASLSIPVQAQYWSGKAWVLNSLDSCTSVPVAAIGRANYLDYKGASTSAWSTTASAVTIVGGNGSFTLTAPSPTATGSVEIAFNLGSTSADNACVSSHASTTGASLSWLRSFNGNCSAAADRDPFARITFGVYTPETRRAVHARELY